jgi:hypothetical protein
MLILGGSATVTSLTGMNTIAVSGIKMALVIADVDECTRLAS